MLCGIMNSGPPWTVTVSGEDTTDADTPGPVTVKVRFNADGTVDEFTSGTYGQIDSATDWIIPNAENDVGFHIRLTVDSGTTPSGDATGSWITLGNAQTREWTLTQTGAGTTTGTYTIAISADGGTTTLDSGTYTLTATVI